ncbi:hypothetical protein [Bacillus cereus]|uniref:hypothetical protein n=1 Tax=Bacillus cereus TaxID=1396 RepID=UPI0018791FF3|nr:hypothetical protein [Bacillus cereus]MBE7122959.1 hypothetical protein [Bacillus cereus]
MSAKYAIAVDGGFFCEEGTCKLRVADTFEKEVEADLIAQTMGNLGEFAECVEIAPQFWEQKHHLRKRNF